MHKLILICEYLKIILKEFLDVENKNLGKFKNLMGEIKPLDEKVYIRYTFNNRKRCK